MNKFLALFLLASAASCLLDEVAATPIVPESQKQDIIIPGNKGNDIKITVLNDKPVPKPARKAAVKKTVLKKARKQGDYSYDNFPIAMQNIPYCQEELPTLDELADWTNYVTELGNQFPDSDTLQADAGYMNLVFCALAKFYAVTDKIIKAEEGTLGGVNESIPDNGDGTDTGSSGDQPTGEEPNGDQTWGNQPTGEDPNGGQTWGDQPSGDQPSDDQPTDDQPTSDEDPNQGSGNTDDQQTQADDSNIHDPKLQTYPSGYATPNDDGGFTIYKPDGTTENVSVDYFDENPDSPYTIVYDNRRRTVRKALRVNLKNFRFSRRNTIKGKQRVAQFRNIFRHAL